jgi:ribulose-phosphate 3-epimerase
VVTNPGTRVDELTEILHLVDLVLVMSVNPGFSGQTFIESTLGKIRRIKGLLDQINPEARLQIDGGITPQTAPWAAEAGAEVFVAGTSIFQHPEGIAAGLDALRRSLKTVEPR